MREQPLSEMGYDGVAKSNFLKMQTLTQSNNLFLIL